MRRGRVMAGTGQDAVRLSDGVWALRDREGLYVGILGGDIDRGWRSHVERLSADDRPAVARALNLGHAFSTGEVAVRTDRRGVVLDLSGGHQALLDDAAAARLQILCTRATGAGGPVTDAAPLPVGSARGGLRVYDVPTLGGSPEVATVAADGTGVVALHLTSTSGPFLLPLPALPVLLAAAEAACDDTAVTLWLTGVGGTVTVLEVDAGPTQRAAADAQWLIPALHRQQEQTGSTSN